MTPAKANPRRAGRKRLYPGVQFEQTSVRLRACDFEKAIAIAGNVSAGVRVALEAYPLPEVQAVGLSAMPFDAGVDGVTSEVEDGHGEADT